jgi:hypothetical protein
MWTTLIPAIIGVVGVLVGAGITTAANYLLAVRKEKAEAAERRVARAAKLKTVARLITNEFLVAQKAARILVEEKRWAPKEIKFPLDASWREFPLDAWQRDRGVIALELPLKEWHAVEMAAFAVERLRDFHLAPGSSDDASDAMAERGKPVLGDITVGLEALNPYMLDGQEVGA